MKIKNYYKKLNTIALSAIVSMSSSLCSGALSDKQKDAVRNIMADMMENYTALSQGNGSTAEEYKQSFAELKLLEEDWDEEVEVNGITTTINKELKKYEQKEKLCKTIESMMDVVSSNFATTSVPSIDTYVDQFEKLNLNKEDWDETVEITLDKPDGQKSIIKTTINKELKKYGNFSETSGHALEEQEMYMKSIDDQEASDKILTPIVIISKNNTVFPKEKAIAFCIKMRKQALDLHDDTPVSEKYRTFCKKYLIVDGMPSIGGFLNSIMIENEKTTIDREFAQFNVVQTLKKTLGNRRAKIIVWSPDNYREAIIALRRYEADLNAQVENYNQGGWCDSSVNQVLSFLQEDYELDKAEQCSLSWMQASVYGKTYLIYQFLSLKEAKCEKLLSAAKGILVLISKSQDFNHWLGDNEVVNISILNCIKFDENSIKESSSVWDLNGDIPYDKFFELLVQIAKDLNLQQSNVDAREFFALLQRSSLDDGNKNIIKALFTYCFSTEAHNYSYLKNKLIERGVLPQDNQ